MEKEIKITPPEGFEIDKENSTFECIKFKPIKNHRWRDDKDAAIKGYCIDFISKIYSTSGFNIPANYNVFATEKQAKSALAMARISQIMANDKRFGGVVTDKEWKDSGTKKYAIIRDGDYISRYVYFTSHHFLVFHTEEQRNLFLKENEDLIRDYLMLD